MTAVVLGHYRAEVERVEITVVDQRFQADDAGEPKDGPLQSRCAHDVFGFQFVTAIQFGSQRRSFRGEQVGESVRVAAAVHRHAGCVDEARGRGHRLRGAHKRRGRVDVYRPRQRAVGVAHRRNARRQMNDGRWRHIGEHRGDLVRLRQIDRAHVDRGGQRRLGCVMRGGDHIEPVCNELLHHRPTDKPVCACDQNGIPNGHAALLLQSGI